MNCRWHLRGGCRPGAKGAHSADPCCTRELRSGLSGGHLTYNVFNLVTALLGAGRQEMQIYGNNIEGILRRIRVLEFVRVRDALFDA